jgi:PAS domain S-box-containing protein
VADRAPRANAQDEIVTAEVERLRRRVTDLERSNTELRARLDGYRRSALFLESVVENIPDMIFVKDAAELRFVRFNRAGEQLLGYARGDLIGKNDHDLFPPDEAEFFIRKDREVLAAGEVVDIPEEPIHTRGQGTRWLHTKKIPIRDHDGNSLYLLGISEDISERKRAAELLARRTADLARSNAELEQFAYVASHDLQEPLRRIRAFGDLLLTEVEEGLDETGRDWLRRMVAAAERMQVLVSSLLALARVRSHGAPFEPVDLAAAAREAVADLEVLLAESGGAVDVAPLPTVEADPTQVRLLFQNLIGNALKFRRPAVPPRVRVHVRARAGAGPGQVTIVVADNGIGFASEDAERIFLPYQRLERAERFGGVGMGLAICARIVDRHRGRIVATGRPGEGATFAITLPRRQPKDGEPA